MASNSVDRQQQHSAWPFGSELVFLNGFIRKEAKDAINYTLC